MKNLNDYKGIWVFAEQREGNIQEVTLEIIGKAREMALGNKDKVTVILIGEDVKPLADGLIYYGADTVIVVEDNLLKDYQTNAYTDVLEKITKKHKPSSLLFGATSIGRDLAPRLATRINAGLSADCIDLEMDKEGILIQTKPSFGGNIMVEIMCPNHRPQMATVRPRVLPTPEKDTSRKGEIIVEQVEVDAANILTTIVERVKESTETEKIEEADIVIAGGRGIDCEEGFDMLNELAKTLGGMVGCTRPPANEGWIPEENQIGQSGKTIAPKLLICCGISGAVQYTVGMENSEVIIAINKDPSAPIFSYADYGIVGDCNNVVPILTQKLKEVLNK